MNSDVEKLSYKEILKQKEYMKIIVAALINRFGDSIDAIASTWIVYQITGSAAWSAAIFGINRLPTILITPFAGAWVECRNKKNIMVITDFVRAICVFLVATCFLLGILQPWMLVLSNFMISTVEAFRGPAGTALTPKILEKKYYSYGMSLLSTLATVMELVGTAAAAGIIAYIGISGAIYIDMITFILSALIICTVKSKEEKQQIQKINVNEYFETLTDGMKYLKKAKTIRFFVWISLFLNAILVPCNSLEVPIVNEILSGGTELLSIMSVATTAAMLLGSFIYPKIDGKVSGKMLLFLSGVGIGIFYIGIVAFQPLYGNKIFMYVFATLLLGVASFVVALANAFISIEFVRTLDERYMARANAVATSISVAALPIVSFIIVGVLSFVSLETILIITALLDMVVCIFILKSNIVDEEKTVEIKGMEEQKSIAV